MYSFITQCTRFPLQYPFSSSFPKICFLVKEFIKSFFIFADGFSQSNNEIDDLLKKSLENILVQTLNGALVRLISTSKIAQVIQIYHNVIFFEKACTMFEDLLMERKSLSARISLQATYAFDDTKACAERRIHELICLNIDQFLDLADYDWVTANKDPRSSTYLSDLTIYLQTMGTSTLTSLPEIMIQNMYKESFSYLARAILATLLNPSIKRLSVQFMDQLDVDISYLEEFMKQFSFLEGEIPFEELKQVMHSFYNSNIHHLY